jgi:hypothetical protein
MEKWKVQSIILGGVLGALVGTAAAFIFIKSAEKLDQKPKLSPGQGVKVGMSLLGILRMFSELGKGS